MALEGKIAVVTGASRGIGKQTALALARDGASLVLAARTEEPRAGTPGTLADTAAEVAAVGPEPVLVRADVSRQDDLDRIVAVTLETFGGVDVLVNNAAYTVGNALVAQVPGVTRAQWEKSFAVNVTAPVMLTQAFWPSMVARGGGVVVNVTSGAAYPSPITESRVPTGIPAIGPAYGSTKAALNRMANLIAGDGLAHRIAVINVEPGFVLVETMAAAFEAQGHTDSDAIPPTIPAVAIAYLCGCPDPMAYSGQIVSAPELVAELGLLPTT